VAQVSAKVADAPEPQRAAAQRGKEGREIPLPAGRGRRILAAEDNPVNQRLLLEMLRKRGHSVVLTSNGLEAVEAFGRERFDIALFDVQMPEMSGLEATAAIRARERELGGHIPIVAITANAMQGDRERCLAAGMDAYIAKPIRRTELFEVIENMPIIQASEGSVQFDGSLFDGDPEFLAEIVNLFLATCPEMLSAIEDAIAQQDADAVRRSAHTLKGAVANFGAAAVVERAKAIEMMGQDGDLSGATGALQSLRLRLEAFQPELRAALVDTIEKQV
jgi:CheY-like chemotaxis protein